MLLLRVFSNYSMLFASTSELVPYIWVKVVWEDVGNKMDQAIVALGSSHCWDAYYVQAAGCESEWPFLHVEARSDGSGEYEETKSQQCDEIMNIHVVASWLVVHCKVVRYACRWQPYHAPCYLSRLCEVSCNGGPTSSIRHPKVWLSIPVAISVGFSLEAKTLQHIGSIAWIRGPQWRMPTLMYIVHGRRVTSLCRWCQ